MSQKYRCGSVEGWGATSDWACCVCCCCRACPPGVWHCSRACSPFQLSQCILPQLENFCNLHQCWSPCTRGWFWAFLNCCWWGTGWSQFSSWIQRLFCQNLYLHSGSWTLCPTWSQARGTGRAAHVWLRGWQVQRWWRRRTFPCSRRYPHQPGTSRTGPGIL